MLQQIFYEPVLSIAFIAALCIAGAANAATNDESPKTLGIVLYPGFEVLDVFGPVEMFMSLGTTKVRVVMIAENSGEIPSGAGGDKAGAWSGPKVLAEYGFDDAPQIDLLMVPGGFGTMQQTQNAACLNFLRERADKAQYVLSVCSGSAILAKAGLLDGKKATCNKQYYGLLTSNGPKVEWQPKARWVEDGKFITSSGVSAGTDMALAVIAKLYGEETANGIAKGTEYVWNNDPTNDPFAKEAK